MIRAGTKPNLSGRLDILGMQIAERAVQLLHLRPLSYRQSICIVATPIVSSSVSIPSEELSPLKDNSEPLGADTHCQPETQSSTFNDDAPLIEPSSPYVATA